MSPDKPFPTLWQEFDAMAQVPLMVVHGANSDILSAATVTAMQARRPDMEVVTVPDQGHAPLLSDAPHDRRHRGVRSEVRCGARLRSH